MNVGTDIDPIVIIAAGPTGTAPALDLARGIYQLSHIDHG